MYALFQFPSSFFMFVPLSSSHSFPATPLSPFSLSLFLCISDYSPASLVCYLYPPSLSTHLSFLSFSSLSPPFSLEITHSLSLSLPINIFLSLFSSFLSLLSLTFKLLFSLFSLYLSFLLSSLLFLSFFNNFSLLTFRFSSFSLFYLYPSHFLFSIIYLSIYLLFHLWH